MIAMSVTSLDTINEEMYKVIHLPVSRSRFTMIKLMEYQCTIENICDLGNGLIDHHRTVNNMYYLDNDLTSHH